MRIALCFHGQPRGLNATALSYLTQEGVEVDSYVHCWWDGTGRYEGVGLHGHTYTVQTPPDFWDQVQRIYAPIHIEKEPPRDLPLTSNFQEFAWAQPAHIMPMTYSIQRTLQLPLDAGRGGDPYDWYVKVRMDLVIKSPPVPWHLLDPSVVYLANIHASGYPDGSLYLIPPRYIEAFRQIYDEIASCGTQGTEEHVLHHFLHNHHIPVRSLHLDYSTDRAQFRVQ